VEAAAVSLSLQIVKQRDKDTAGVPQVVGVKINSHKIDSVSCRYKVVSDEDLRLAALFEQSILTL
jgi:hypothetical protein